MKIAHCCLADFYIDNYGYQQNILPKMHKIQEHEVRILASTETYLKNKSLGYVKPSTYLTPEGISITRIPYKKFLPHFLMKKIRLYSGIIPYLMDFKPDIIFLHDTQFMGVTDIVKYAKRNMVTIIADGHADFIKHQGRNSILNWFSQKILHGIFYRWCAQHVEPYTKKFYGVLPLRVEFIKNIYGIPEAKVELLVMGADDTKFDLSNKDRVKNEVRKRFNISEEDFLVVTGGRIDSTKKIEQLMNAISRLKSDKVKLLVFGKPDNTLKTIFDHLIKSEKIIDVGWIDASEVYSLFIAADIVFFPGTHSVLWEQAVGAGAPCVFKRWPGVEHVDVGGNCIFIEDSEVETIIRTIQYLLENPSKLFEMKSVAEKKGVPYFSYFDIAKRSIQ